MDRLHGKIGLVLGSGAARGWAHVGVIRALEERGLSPEVVVGSSAGAVAGAYYAAGKLDELENFGRNLDRRRVLSYFDISMRGGLITARKLIEELATQIGEEKMETLPKPFGAVATDLATGQEVWLREGNLPESLRASMALPGLVQPVRIDGRWLVDGGLTNPVPVSLARSLGADSVIAVDLNTTLLTHRFPDDPSDPSEGELQTPSIYDVVTNSISIMQVRITRSRSAGDPPDVLVAPKLSDFAMLDFHRASEAIEVGRRALNQALHEPESN